MKPVYFFGHISCGELIELKMPFPQNGGYAEMGKKSFNVSGEACGSAQVLKRLGMDVILEGNWLGDNDNGRKTLAFLKKRGIDTSGIVIKEGYEGVNELVFSDGNGRTVFGRYIDLLFTTPQWPTPSKEKIEQASLVCVDPSFGETALNVLKHAGKQGIYTMSIDAKADSEISRNSSLIIVSQEFLSREYPDADWEELFRKYRRTVRGKTVFTFGGSPLWWHDEEEGIQKMPPFKIEEVDSAGAGDSFRGALIYGILQKMSFPRALRFASALAAIVCTRSPGVMNSPTLDEVNEFIDKNP